MEPGFVDAVAVSFSDGGQAAAGHILDAAERWGFRRLSPDEVPIAVRSAIGQGYYYTGLLDRRHCVVVSTTLQTKFVLGVAVRTSQPLTDERLRHWSNLVRTAFTVASPETLRGRTDLEPSEVDAPALALLRQWVNGELS